MEKQEVPEVIKKSDLAAYFDVLPKFKGRFAEALVGSSVVQFDRATGNFAIRPIGAEKWMPLVLEG